MVSGELEWRLHREPRYRVPPDGVALPCSRGTEKVGGTEKRKKEFWDHPNTSVSTHLGSTEKDPKLEIRYRHKKSRERDSNERDGSEPRDEGGGRKRPAPDPDLQRRAGSGTGVGAMLARGSASPHKSSPQPLVATPSQVSGCHGWDR